MAMKRDPLQSTLALFEAKGGWKVDYTTYSMKCSLYVDRRRNIHHYCKLHPAESKITFVLVIGTRYSLTSEASEFLNFTKEKIEKDGGEISWNECKALTLKYVLPARLSTVKRGDPSLFDFIHVSLVEDETFLISCAWVLDMYARFERRKKAVPEHWTPQRLLEFCLHGDCNA